MCEHAGALYIIHQNGWTTAGLYGPQMMTQLTKTKHLMDGGNNNNMFFAPKDRGCLQPIPKIWITPQNMNHLNQSKIIPSMVENEIGFAASPTWQAMLVSAAPKSLRSSRKKMRPLKPFGLDDVGWFKLWKISWTVWTSIFKYVEYSTIWLFNIAMENPL